MVTNHGLWNRNFCLLVLANVFLYASVYVLFPVLHRWIQVALECDDLHAALITSVFGIAPFLSGPFNAYLVDRFRRKHVCVYSILLLAVITMCYGYVSDMRWMIVWMLLQGAMFGTALMSMGGTLVIDVTPSHHRDRANACFTWAGVVGILAGIVLGINGGLPFVISSDGEFMFSACLALVSVLLVSAVRVCFRAPLDVPLLSFDRFLLFRTFLPVSARNGRLWIYSLLSLHGCGIFCIFAGEPFHHAESGRTVAERCGNVADACLVGHTRLS